MTPVKVPLLYPAPTKLLVVLATFPPTCSMLPLIAAEEVLSLTFLPMVRMLSIAEVVVIPTFSFLGRVLTGLFGSFALKSLPFSSDGLKKYAIPVSLTKSALYRSNFISSN